MKSRLGMTLLIALYLGISTYTLAAIRTHGHAARTAVAALSLPR
ncbi:MAG TPA: hypothetical protein VGP48_08110 [Stellaceae bacterium]|jgi:hypothetical protein|nr:hypothetical protein [Stellaceae bacterium]